MVADDSFDFADWDSAGFQGAESGLDWDDERHDECLANWLGQMALQFDVDPELAGAAAVSRSTRPRPWLPPGYRTRILMRDMARCVICNSNQALEVGHLISVSAGRKLGLGEEEIYSADNLAAMCFKCNRDLGSECPPIRFVLNLWRTRRENTARLYGA